MDYVTAQNIAEEIQASVHADLYKELVAKALRYARIRGDWAAATPDERMEMDSTRTRAHDAFIDSCNILSRAMMKSSEDNSWRELLGTDRQDIGDFACYLHCILGIKAR